MIWREGCTACPVLEGHCCRPLYTSCCTTLAGCCGEILAVQMTLCMSCCTAANRVSALVEKEAPAQFPRYSGKVCYHPHERQRSCKTILLAASQQLSLIIWVWAVCLYCCKHIDGRELAWG